METEVISSTSSLEQQGYEEARRYMERNKICVASANADEQEVKYLAIARVAFINGWVEYKKSHTVSGVGTKTATPNVKEPIMVLMPL